MFFKYLPCYKLVNKIWEIIFFIMIKNIFCCFSFIIFFFSYAHSACFDADVPLDFETMLKAPSVVGKPSESLATRVTRPFVAGLNKDVNFFSDPKRYYAQWCTLNGASIDAVGVLDTMGISRRSLLNHGSGRYASITNAQATGMLGVLSGKNLGFDERAATETERDIMTKELLNMGLKAGGDLPRMLWELEVVYNTSSVTPTHKNHLQMCALYLLKGAGSSIIEGQWYLRGIRRESVARTLDTYAAKFLPAKASATGVRVGAGSRGGAGTGAAADPKSVLVAPLRYRTERQAIYGTSDLKGSGINALLSGYARYPNIMVLGSHKVPMKKPDDMFSISAKVGPDHYFVIMAPEDGLNPPVLRPHYMAVNGDDSSAAEGRGEAQLQVQYLDDTEGHLNIHWEVRKGSEDEAVALPARFSDLRSRLRSSISEVLPKVPTANDGSLNITDGRKITNEDGETTYSLIVRVLRGAPEKRFYYWCPTPSQIDLLKEFSKGKESFTLQELYSYIRTFNEDDAVPGKILGQIGELLNGNLAGFQK